MGDNPQGEGTHKTFLRERRIQQAAANSLSTPAPDPELQDLGIDPGEYQEALEDATVVAAELDVVAHYQSMIAGKSELDDISSADNFFERHREVLERYGIKHFATLSSEEQAVVDKWHDMRKRGVRGKDLLKFYNDNKYVLADRYARQNKGRLF